MVARTKNDDLIGTIAKYKAIRHVSDDRLAMAARLAPRTYRNRKQKPESFSLKEIRGIFDCLKVPEEERMGYL